MLNLFLDKPILLISQQKHNAYSDIVYAPFSCHYSSYVSQFLRLNVCGEENDAWDLVTRFTNTKSNDKYVFKNRIQESSNIVLNSQVVLKADIFYNF